MAKQKIYEGGCLCGNIRFSATGIAHKPHTCSCTICQRHSGSLSQMWVEFQQNQVKWTGPGGTPSKWRSSDYSSRAFFSICGSTIGAIDDKPTLAIAVGTFDSPNRKELAPEFHSHVSTRPKWWGIFNPSIIKEKLSVTS